MNYRLLISGGSGTLGRKLIPHLLKAGYSVRISSRRDRKPNFFPEGEWARASLETGEGLGEFVAFIPTGFKFQLVYAGDVAKRYISQRPTRFEPDPNRNSSSSGSSWKRSKNVFAVLNPDKSKHLKWK